MAQAITRTPVKLASSWPWAAIFGRGLVFVLMQVLLALGLRFGGSAAAWEDAQAWWPLTVTAANLVCLAVLIGLYRAEGVRYWDIFQIRREHFKSDLLAILGFMLIAGPLGFLPNILLAGWLFADPLTGLNLMIRPLPMWGAVAGLILFPLTQGLVELPVYFTYALPRLERQGLPRWQAIGWPALMLGLQHMAVPLILDLPYLTWRGLMFLPFATFLGIVLHWRPRLLPYLAIVHVLMDASFAAMLLGVAF
jgi:hypothetical protein